MVATDPPPGVVRLKRGPLALAELEGRLGLPFLVEPPDFGQLPVPQVRRYQPHHAARVHRAELGCVPSQDGAGTGGPDHGQDRGQVLGGDLAGLVHHHHVLGSQPHGAPGPTVLQAAKEPGHVDGLRHALGGHDPGRVRGERHAHGPAAGPLGPGPGDRGHGVRLARARRGHQYLDSRPPGQEPSRHLGLGRVQVRQRQRQGRLGRGDQLGDLAGRLADQILLQIQVGRGGVSLRARRGVHAATVRRAEPERGHVHHVRGRAEGQHRARGHRLGRQLLGQGGLVHPRRHGRHGPVDLPQQRGPGERGGRALGRVYRAADDAPTLLR